jgi:hypothetical protein
MADGFRFKERLGLWVLTFVRTTGIASGPDEQSNIRVRHFGDCRISLRSPGLRLLDHQ